jgi:hypothetical protein
MIRRASCALGCLASLAAGGVALLRRYKPTPAPPQASPGLKTGGDGCTVETYPTVVLDPDVESVIERVFKR